jgi:hypothetical protein
MLIPSDFFGFVSDEQEFVNIDNQEQFEINCRALGSNWHWYNQSFTYRINGHGYRMNKDLSDVDLDNYLAFFGCSYTVGIGLPLEETFAYRIAKQSNMDYINGAVPAVSCDFVLANFVELISHTPVLPRAVVINWPDIARTMYWSKNQRFDFFSNIKITQENKYWASSYRAYVLEDTNMLKRFDLARDVIVSMCRLADIPLIEFTTEQSSLGNTSIDFAKKYENIFMVPWSWPGDSTITYTNQNLARDIYPKNFPRFPALDNRYDFSGWAHPGLDHQQSVVDYFFSKIKL